MSEEEIQLLLNFFLPYTYCPDCCTSPDQNLDKTTTELSSSSNTSNDNTIPMVCGAEGLDEETAKLVKMVKEEVLLRGEDVCSKVIKAYVDVDSCSSSSSSSSQEGFNSTEEVARTFVSSNESTDATSSTSSSHERENSSGIKEREGHDRLVCKKGHLLRIDASCVTKALREFIERYNFVKRDETPMSLRERLSARRVTISRSLTLEDIKEFWKRYRDLFPPSKESLWDGLLVGLKRYYETLKERQRLTNETEFLKKQNAELRRLLKTYTVETGGSAITDTEISSSAKT